MDMICLASEWTFGSIGWLILIVLFILYRLDAFLKPQNGDFICPKCRKKTGVLKTGIDMVGSARPWEKHKCTNCGYRW